ncbi:C-type mannose receptor 2-like [Xiphophorus couchianus]|uniref:C-type mannose receptor 2-like n=1 Tax=Xiphophorus couchianus TaxID=32473 RepID=UPI001016D1FD|nr:C-type mannose receptor 2-like [Xiphophorus couchianus]
MTQILFLLILLGKCCFMDCQLYQFHYINENKNWTEAQQYCREKHTDLATVTNMEGLTRLLSKSPGTMAEAWIGLYGQTNGIRKWYWSLPGVEFNVNITEWDNAEPDDHDTENCGFILESLKWGDISCNREKYFLCYNERKTSDKFHLIEQSKTWLAAQSYCRKEHTDLVSGLDQVTDEQLRKVLSSTDSLQDKLRYVFMGLFRDTWRWSDGSSFSFRHWNLQFDDEQNNSGQCALVEFSGEGRWKNVDCSVTKPFFCYDDKLILINQNKTWEDALYYCRDHHHDLVTITNMDDQIWIREKVKKATSPLVWTGLRYTCTLDFWFWVSDEVVSYHNWASDELMDDCDMSGAMETGGEYKWFKRNDANMFNFVCSKHPLGE